MVKDSSYLQVKQEIKLQQSKILEDFDQKFQVKRDELQYKLDEINDSRRFVKEEMKSEIKDFIQSQNEKDSELHTQIEKLHKEIEHRSLYQETLKEQAAILQDKQAMEEKHQELNELQQRQEMELKHLQENLESNKKRYEEIEEELLKSQQIQEESLEKYLAQKENLVQKELSELEQEYVERKNDLLDEQQLLMKQFENRYGNEYGYGLG